MLTLRFLNYAAVLVTVGLFFFAMFGSGLREYTGIRANTSKQSEHTVDMTNAPVTLGKIDPNRKYAVFSTTSGRNVESLGFIFMLPLTALAWKRIGFDSIVIIAGSENVWNSDPLLYSVLTSVRQLDALVIFLDVHPSNSVMLSQVTSNCCCFRCETCSNF